ncbi:unnamed protein product [Ranitomeya imitator]|uniref:Tenascin-X n=1 Tax=Ranitomeya imitator TaxID=111125 RepID=A0ABN9LPE8_9NEOB|nr:unnamed protein product [Ranitomeya imitator]
MDPLPLWRVLAVLLLCCPYHLLTSGASIKVPESKSCSSEKALSITHIYSVPGEDNEQLQTMESDDNKLVFRHLLRLQSPAEECQKNAFLDDLLARLQALELGMTEMKEQYEGCCGAAAVHAAASVPRDAVCEGPGMTSRSRDRDIIPGPSHTASLGTEAAACTAEEIGGRRKRDTQARPAERRNAQLIVVNSGNASMAPVYVQKDTPVWTAKRKNVPLTVNPTAEEYTGVDCKEKKCAVDCQPNGRCVNGACVCAEGYTGVSCKEKKCAVDCRPNGRCVNGVCVCAEGYTGVRCKEKKCAVDCRPNGRCVNGVCVCDEGFMGADCSVEMAGLCSFNGRYNPVTRTCVCDEGWEGPDCSQRSCPNNCANNGVCVNGVCQCAVGFTGPDCSERACLLDCGENGRCVDGACQCNVGFTGVTCLEEDCLVNCGENGRCDGGQCFCEEGFFGESCSEVMAVQNLRLISTTEDSLNVAWDLLVEVDYYYISYYPFGDESQKRQIKVSANQDFYQIGGLNPSTLYKVMMYQVKNGVTSDPAEIQGRTDDSALGTLWVTEETEDSLDVEWENPDIRVDYFKLKYAAQPGGAETEVQVSQSKDPKTRYIIKGG